MTDGSFQTINSFSDVKSVWGLYKTDHPFNGRKNSIPSIKLESNFQCKLCDGTFELQIFSIHTKYVVKDWNESLASSLFIPFLDYQSPVMKLHAASSRQ